MRELVILMLITAALAWCADHVTMGPMNHAQRHRLVFCTLLIIILLAGWVVWGFRWMIGKNRRSVPS